MAYQAPYIDATGAHIPTYQDILDYLITKFKAIYGEDIYLEDDSQDYQFLSSLALIYYDCCQTFLLAYNNQSPTSAIGVSLDRLCAINGIVRREKSYSTCIVQLTGKPNASISYGQVSDINGYVWQLNENITFDEDGNAESIATCTIAGSIQASSNTITTIATPTQNWYTVNNESPALPGEEVEKDSSLRERRYDSVSILAVSPFDSIISYLKTLTDEDGISIVKRVAGYENDTSLTVDMLPPHSIAIVVECSDTQEVKAQVGEAIYLKKSPGVQTYKDPTTGVSVDIRTKNGLTNTINFNIPEELSPEVTINIVQFAGFTDAIEDKIKESVVKYLNSLAIGETVYISNLYLPILQSNPDSSNPSFYISSVSMQLEGGQSKTDELEIGRFQAINCTIANITVNKLVQ